VQGWRNGLRQGQDGYWHYRFRLNGQTFEGTTGCPLYRDALQWLNAYKGRISKGEVGLKSMPTVKQAFEHLMAEKKSRTSKAHQDRARRAIGLHVLPHIGHKPADQVTKQHVEEILRVYLAGESKRIMEVGKGRKRTKHGANTLLLYIKMIFNHLVKHHYLATVPFSVEPIKAPQPHRAFVPIELEPMFFTAIDRTHNLQVMVAVRAMFWLGLRESEALAMRWEGLSWNLLRYTPGSTEFDQTKGGEAVSLPTEQSLRVLLWAIIWKDFDGIKPLQGWILPGEDGHPHRPQYTKKAILRAGKAIRVQGLTPHRLRAGLATNLARAGFGAHHIKKALRHKQLQTSEHYVMLGQDDLVEGLSALKKRAQGE